MKQWFSSRLYFFCSRDENKKKKIIDFFTTTLISFNGWIIEQENKWYYCRVIHLTEHLNISFLWTSML